MKHRFMQIGPSCLIHETETPFSTDGEFRIFTMLEEELDLFNGFIHTHTIDEVENFIEVLISQSNNKDCINYNAAVTLGHMSLMNQMQEQSCH
jgi:hypothetical protein